MIVGDLVLRQVGEAMEQKIMIRFYISFFTFSSSESTNSIFVHSIQTAPEIAVSFHI